ncbi:MAG: hypothetical protein WDZ50_01435 [Woeseia sp.]
MSRLYNKNARTLLSAATRRMDAAGHRPVAAGKRAGERIAMRAAR